MGNDRLAPLCGALREQGADSSDVLGMLVHAVSLQQALAAVLNSARKGESRMVCAADVHMVMRHHDEADFREAMLQADLVTPDGMPLVWLLRRQGFKGQERVCGPDLTLELCAAAAAQGIPVGFYGSRPEVLEALVGRLMARFPELKVGYAYSPPFRLLTLEEDQAQVDAIRASGVRMLFVGLGCPKQERWMAEHKGRIQAVMLGVGAAFDFHAGTIKRAPKWMQRAGCEWLYRLWQEPRRIFMRIARYHTRFVWLILVRGGLKRRA